MSCHASCLTCSSQLFNACLSCPTGLTLSNGACFCDSVWQSACSGETTLRPMLHFLTMFMQLLVVGVMLLYVLRVRLPLSYRVWSGLNGLSLLLYN